MTDNLNPFGLSSIEEARKGNFIKSYGENFRKTLALDWIFDKTYEKIIIVGSLFWALVSLIIFLWGVLK